MKNKKMFLHLAIAVLAVLLVSSVFYLQNQLYRIKIYYNNAPSDAGAMLIEECNSLSPNFECRHSNTDLTGYFVKVVAYKDGSVLTESEWKSVD